MMSPLLLILLALLACAGSVGLQLYLKDRAGAENAGETAGTPEPDASQPPRRQFEPEPDPVRETFVLRGRAEDETGAPVVGADVRIGLLQGDRWTELVQLESAEDGSFGARLPQLDDWRPESLINLHLEARALAPNRQPLQVQAALPTDDSEIEFVLPFLEGHSISGAVVDESQEPVVGATVKIFLNTPADTPNSEKKRTVTTDEQGLFVCGWPLDCSPRFLDAKHPDAGLRTLSLESLAKDEDLVLEEAVQLDPGNVLSGTIRCPNGSLLPDVRIVARREKDAKNGSNRGRRRSVLTGPDGAFYFTELEAEDYVLIIEDASEYIGPFAAGTRNIEVEIEAPRLVIAVRDSAGRPLPGAPVQLVNVSSRGPNNAPLFEFSDHVASGEDATITFAPAQRFVAGADPTALKLAVVMRGGAANLPPFEQRIEIPDNACRIDHTFRYLPRASYGELRVRLADPRGGLVGDPQVTVISANTDQVLEDLADIDPDPEAWACVVAPGDYSLLVQPVAAFHDHGHLLPTPAPSTVRVEPSGAADLDLVAHLGGRVELELELREAPATKDKPRVRGVTPFVKVRCTADNATAFSDGNARRELHFATGTEDENFIPVEGTHLATEALPPGGYSLQVYGDDVQTTRVHFDIRAGETSTVRVVVPER